MSDLCHPYLACCTPLYKHFHDDTPWKQTKTCQQAFDKAKLSVSQSPVLVHYDVSRPIKLNCDASSHGVAACMMHVIDGKE